MKKIISISFIVWCVIVVINFITMILKTFCITDITIIDVNALVSPVSALMVFNCITTALYFIGLLIGCYLISYTSIWKWLKIGKKMKTWVKSLLTLPIMLFFMGETRCIIALGFVFWDYIKNTIYLCFADTCIHWSEFTSIFLSFTIVVFLSLVIGVFTLIFNKKSQKLQNF